MDELERVSFTLLRKWCGPTLFVGLILYVLVLLRWKAIIDWGMVPQTSRNHPPAL